MANNQVYVKILEKIKKIVQFLDPYLLTPLWEFAADHFLNPRVLNQEESDIPSRDLDFIDAFDGREDGEGKEELDAMVGAVPARQAAQPENFLEGQSPERIETVLNSGMAFISGLMEMATGQKIKEAAAQEKMVRINKETGEVTMSFKLPGWG